MARVSPSGTRDRATRARATRPRRENGPRVGASRCPRPGRQASSLRRRATFARPSVRGGGTCHYWALFAPVPRSGGFSLEDSHSVFRPHENKNSFSDFSLLISPTANAKQTLSNARYVVCAAHTFSEASTPRRGVQPAYDSVQLFVARIARVTRPPASPSPPTLPSFKC